MSVEIRQETGLLDSHLRKFSVLLHSSNPITPSFFNIRKLLKSIGKLLNMHNIKTKFYSMTPQLLVAPKQIVSLTSVTLNIMIPLPEMYFHILLAYLIFHIKKLIFQQGS